MLDATPDIPAIAKLIRPFRCALSSLADCCERFQELLRSTRLGVYSGCVDCAEGETKPVSLALAPKVLADSVESATRKLDHYLRAPAPARGRQWTGD